MLNLVDTAVDKILPDATEKERLKAQLKLSLLEHAMQEKKLLFADLQSARELYKEELREQGVWSAVKSLRALVRPFIALSSVGFYIYAKLTGLPLDQWDYALLGGVFGFYFGVRTLEKVAGKAG
ncbi:MAG: hypothetical protein GXO39_04775 [Thermotogae bacterium]|nr:hypothetical protein [Thermotogota bacterium]